MLCLGYPGYSSSMVLSWLPGQDYPFVIELENTQPNKVDCVHLAPLHTNWPHLRVLQLLFLTDHTYGPEHTRTSVGSVPAEDTAPGRLSPIPEEHNSPATSGEISDIESLESLAAYLSHDDPALQSCLSDTLFDPNTPISAGLVRAIDERAIDPVGAAPVQHILETTSKFAPLKM